MKYHKSMEFYFMIKNSGIPIMTQEEFFCLFGNSYTNIDYIIHTPQLILTFKMAFKVPSIDMITEDETQKFVDSTLSLAHSTGIKCHGYFIGNVKMTDNAYSIFKKVKQTLSEKILMAFCCDSDQTKLNAKILKMLYSNSIYLYDRGGDCIMIDA